MRKMINMIRVKKLIERLKEFPEDALVHAYEGEIVGIVVRSANNGKQLGWILANEFKKEEDECVHDKENS